MCRALFIRAVTFCLAAAVAFSSTAEDRYVIDDAHTSVTFKISHLGLSEVHGRFDVLEGTVLLDTVNPAKSSFAMTIKADSINTNKKQRDDHLRSPDFFDVKQFPEIIFKSSAVKQNKEGYEVTGSLTLHGQTRPLTLQLVGGKSAEFPQGVMRTGFVTDFVLKRSDFGMKTMLGPVGDEVYASVSFEAIKQ